MSLREEPPEALTTSVVLAEREATVFEDEQPLIWIRLAGRSPTRSWPARSKCLPTSCVDQWGWTDENPLAQDSWISLPRIGVPRLSTRFPQPADRDRNATTRVAFYTTVPRRGERIHTVREGEQLTTISAQGGHPLATIHALNPGVARQQDLQPGMRLKLPIADRTASGWPHDQVLLACPGPTRN